MAYSSRHKTFIVAERVLTVAVILLGIGYYAVMHAGPRPWRSDGLYAVVRQILEWYVLLPVVLGLVAAVVSALCLRRWYLWLFAIAVVTFLGSVICSHLAYGPLKKSLVELELGIIAKIQPNMTLMGFADGLSTVAFITASWGAVAVIFDVVRRRPRPRDK